MTPKPQFISCSQRRRLPERKAMTIGIGFLCQDGVVLAADRQVTVEGYYKDHQSKLTVITHPQCHVVSTYAYLPNLANVLNHKVNLYLQTLHKPYGEEIVRLITSETQRLKQQYPSEMESQQFLWAISTESERARLLRISGGIIDEPDWACIGIGDSSLVRYIISQLAPIHPRDLPAKDGALLAVYVVQQAKAFVDGCGGPTDAAITYDKGVERPLEEVDYRAIETEFESLQFAFRYLYSIWTISQLPADERNRLMEDLGEFVKAKRADIPKP
jgi:20S proteasome alpha/beta subunit